MEILVPLLFIGLSLVLLYFGAEGLVGGASSLALRFGLSPLVVGLTVVAYGTSTPELMVSVQSALAGKGDLAMGNVVGSNIFNIAVILGLAALISPMTVKLQLIKIDTPIMIAVSLLSLLLIADGRIDTWEAALLFFGIIAYSGGNIWWALKYPTPEVEAEYAEGVPAKARPLWRDLLWIGGGLGLLMAGSQLLVDNSVLLARMFGVSEAVIGLTIVAAGTSMPELATSFIAALKGQSDIALGNVIGSNLYNLLAILGMAGLITPLTAPGVTPVDFGFMVLTAVLVWPLIATGKVVQRWEGALLLAIYGIYLYLVWPK